MSARFRRLVGDLQVVGDAEDATDAVGADIGCVLVGLAIHDAVQFDMAILHRDADGLGGSIAYRFREGNP